MAKRKITLKTPDSNRPLEVGTVIVRPKLRREPETIPAGAVLWFEVDGDAEEDKRERARELRQVRQASHAGTLCCVHCGDLFYFAPENFQIARYYLLESEEAVKILEETVYCWNCEAVTRAEIIHSRDAECLLDEEEARQEELKTIIDQYEMANWLLRVFKSELQYNEAKYELIEITRAICMSLDRLDFLDNRVGPRRCLQCGDYRVEEFDKPFASDPRASASTYAAHPDCGGMIYTKPRHYTHINYTGDMGAKYYSPEGEFLRNGRTPKWDFKSYYFVA